MQCDGLENIIAMMCIYTCTWSTKSGRGCQISICVIIKPNNGVAFTVPFVEFRGVARILQGGGQELTFLDLEICMSRSDIRHALC